MRLDRRRTSAPGLKPGSVLDGLGGPITASSKIGSSPIEKKCRSHFGKVKSEKARVCFFMDSSTSKNSVVAVLNRFTGLRPAVTTPTSAAAAPLPPGPPAELPAAAASSAHADDSLVRTRPEKNGGAIAPGVIEVRPHQRSAPGAAGKEKQPVTAEVIVREYGKNERQTTHRAALRGRPGRFVDPAPAGAARR